MRRSGDDGWLSTSALLASRNRSASLILAFLLEYGRGRDSGRGSVTWVGIVESGRMEGRAGFVEGLANVRVFAEIGEELQPKKHVFVPIRA